MNENLEETLLEENPPYNLEELNAETILDDKIFEYIFAIQNIGKREQEISKLQQKAKKIGMKTSFERVLKQYEKAFLKEKRQEGKNNMLKPSHNDIATKLLENNSIMIYEDDLYIYNNGFYSKNQKDIERKIIELVPEATSYFRGEVCRNLFLRSDNIKELNRESGIINFKNGLFNTKNGKMYKHTQKFFSINQIKTNLNLQAPKVQAIDEVLEKLSCGINERKQTILEIIGYSMTTSVKLQKAFVLYGETARNGKSTLINIIIELIGRENIGTVSFKDINKNRFAASGIKGKLLNVGNEMTDEYIEDIEILKMWITGDYLDVEEKFKAKQKILPYAKFIFNANKLPTVADKTDGFYRRLQIIPLEYSFTDKDASKFNFQELVTKEALEYLAKISVEAYMNKGEHFANYEENESEIGKYKIQSNSILSFINDRDFIMSIIENNKVRYANEVYAYYKQHCNENQKKPIGRNKFFEEIEKSKLITVTKFHNKKVYTFDSSFYRN